MRLKKAYRKVDVVLFTWEACGGTTRTFSNYEFLAPEPPQSIQRSDSRRWLKEGIETSVVGLHIIDAQMAWSFGPLLQFVFWGAGRFSGIDARDRREKLTSFKRRRGFHDR